MSFKDILSKLDQLSEGDVKHTGTYGTSYGKEDVRDQYGHKIGKVDKEAGAKKEAPKRGRGRPKKGADDSGEVKSYDSSALSAAFGGGKKPSKPVGKVSAKHSLKEYFDEIDARVMNEAEQLTIEPAKQNTQVIRQGTKTLGTVSNPQLAQQIKQSIGKGEMSLMPNQGMAEDGGEKWIQKAVKHPGAFTAKAKAAGKSVAAFAKEKAHAPGKLGKQARLAQTLRKMDEADLPPQDGLMGAGLGAGRKQGAFESAKPDYIDLDKDGNKKESMKKAATDAKKDKKKVDESMDNRLKAAHHRGKAHALSKESYNCKYDDMEEARMYHEGYKEGLDECYGQVPIRGLVTTDEGMAGAALGGIAGGVLGGPAGAVRGAGLGSSVQDALTDEGADATVDDMASFGARTPAMEDDMEEGNAFTAALAKTPKGGKFNVGGKTFTDTSNLEEANSMFESWDNQLGSLLEEYQEIQEGMTVSISKGQQGAPDSVSVTAQDGEADKLLALVKSAGLGLFGDENAAAEVGVPAGDQQHGGVDVVGDHDGMMALIKKATGSEAPGTLEPASGEDYKDEQGDSGLDMIKQLTQKLHGEEHGEKQDEGTCNECGMMETECGCDHEKVEEVESEDQQEYQVAEDNPPDNGAEEFQAMDAEIAQDNAAASSHGGADNSNLEEETEEEAEANADEGEAEVGADEQDSDELEESYANSDDDAFEADIDFMTKIISGGLNKQKSTGQTTIPVIAGQDDRMGYSVNESALTDWKKLAGLK